uniref:Uncharacterized protein n=1 Tax=Amphimedon queenslandica TaxID=400682 RepID=A0A1X7UW58_AMPQE
MLPLLDVTDQYRWLIILRDHSPTILQSFVLESASIFFLNPIKNKIFANKVTAQYYLLPHAICHICEKCLPYFPEPILLLDYVDQ